MAGPLTSAERPTAKATSTSVDNSNSNSTNNSLDDRLSQLLNSNSHFNVASYLNLALQHQSDGDDKKTSEGGLQGDNVSLQSRMAELALQLQLLTSTCHEDIGRIGAELQAILPRCAADVGRVDVGLEGMRMDAQSLLEQTKMNEEEQEISSSLETLSTLHALQSNLNTTKQVLTAAATWDSTMSSITPLLAQQKLTEAVDALAKLERGERALRGMPNREDRQLAIAKVRQQVQTLLQPQLKQAIQHMNNGRLAPLQACVTLYEKLDKLDSLQEDYIKARPAVVHKAWFAFSPSYTADGERNAEGGDFAEFLPTWYDMVLHLLTEERKQSITIFTADAAPDIILKVMTECFRPLLSSFESRLESMFSSNPDMNSKGSFESICAVYESTLRFLSLAYELVAGAFLDLTESGLKKGDTGVVLYQEMLSVILKIASPFKNYQQRFDRLEGNHLKTATSSIANDMRQLGSASPTIETIQTSTDSLADLAPYIFPLAEGSLVRFELLNGGFRITPALAVIDQILSRHVGEVTITVQSLSATMTADLNHLADNFDEQHVICAMEVLKVAGNFRRDLKTFETKTQDKMGILSERIMDHLQRHEEVKTSLSKGGVSSSFSLPDALSVVEIDSIVTKAVCDDSDSISSQTNDSTVITLNQLASGDSKGASVLIYPEATRAIQRLAHSCHKFVFDICSAVPRKHLLAMSDMSSWGETSGADSLDSYGTLPQAYITQVGEHMLALVQAFEPFASNPDSLAIANEVMDGLKEVALHPWEELMSSSGVEEMSSVVPALMQGQAMGDLVLNNTSLSEEDAQLEEGASDEERAIASFCNSWLDVIGLGVTGRLLERITRISRLTQKGCEHLNADLNYLVNVFSALGVAGHPHPLICHLAAIVMLNEDQLREQIMSRSSRSTLEKTLRSIEMRIAMLRGLAIG